MIVRSGSDVDYMAKGVFQVAPSIMENHSLLRCDLLLLINILRSRYAMLDSRAILIDEYV